ncbi:MAG: DNRLRE domain-containing protein, partial [PVC group bacterium]|nr:DNRLRE domain-containing protein [PVC group bacterium]
MMVYQLDLPDSLEAFVENNKVSSKDGERLKLTYSGNGKMHFKSVKNKNKFFIPEDIAFWDYGNDLTDASNITVQTMWREFYHVDGKNYLVTGVSLKWLYQQPRGTIVVDPAIATLYTCSDYSLFSTTNLKEVHYVNSTLNVGNSATTGYAHSIMKFDLSSINLSTTILNADLEVDYIGTSPTSTTAFNIECFKLERDWDPEVVCWQYAAAGDGWTSPGGDYDAMNLYAETTFDNNLGKKLFSILSLVDFWRNNPEQNYGLLLKAKNEASVDHTKRMFSSHGNAAEDQPKLKITYQGEQLAQYSYDAESRPVEVIYGSDNNVTETNRYDEHRGWLLERTYVRNSDGSNIYKFRTDHPDNTTEDKTGYDVVGNLKYVKYQHKNDNEEYMEFNYDNHSQLESCVYVNETTTTWSYLYDDNGNILSKEGKAFSYENGAAFPRTNKLLSDGTRNFAYDKAGR